MNPVMTVEDLNRFLDTDFPEVHTDGRVFEVVSVGPGTAVMRFDPLPRHLRPGATVSGPALFALADVTAYVTLVSHIGPVALAVTTNLNINFLRKPEPKPLECRCRILKLGKRLAVLDAEISAAGDTDIVAHATATYSIPPK
ncbi:MULTISPECIES: PaaI family thioesterase [unclassified Rhizobium]|uniref:PaaI family thioesterase n=1 Tax=unclassified Rhizobium TaxID=2613769 RepID=UPI0006F3E5E5|nr:MULTISPECIES: PaaI family thioesterase [unclassified Rhizobium]KQV43309.1 thioesterase [Rhizobium sp. Root1212]KRD37494.1 thioesterase [Rhizobium sp. Root268]